MQQTPQQAADTLRQSHRAKRAALPATLLSAHADALAGQVADLTVFTAAEHIAAYVAIRGEIDPAPLLHLAHDHGKSVYLPVLRGDEMQFWPWRPGDALVKRGMGLLEPDTDTGAPIDPARLDLVLAPLVVFDEHCQRIGQGGGFYDRTFAFRRETHTPHPYLLGVAHDSQREPRLTPMPWDVPLDMIATERTFYCAPDKTE